MNIFRLFTWGIFLLSERFLYRQAIDFVVDLRVCFNYLQHIYLNLNSGMLPINSKAVRRIFTFSMFLLINSFGANAHLAFAQENGISEPSSGELLSGVINVVGTAVHPDYLRYELAFFNEANPGAGWIVFAEGEQPVQSNVLAVWDTTVGRATGNPVFPDGRYQLRLRVVKTDFNYDEYFVTDLTIFNSGPTPEPTPNETAVALTATAQSILPNPESTSGSTGFQQPTPLPSLTPFPTPTGLPTAVSNSQVDQNNPGENSNGGGVVGQLERVDPSKFSQAFWNGVRITVLIFGLIALYLIVRRLGRIIWRAYWVNKE